MFFITVSILTKISSFFFFFFLHLVSHVTKAMHSYSDADRKYGECQSDVFTLARSSGMSHALRPLDTTVTGRGCQAGSRDAEIGRYDMTSQASIPLLLMVSRLGNYGVISVNR